MNIKKFLVGAVAGALMLGVMAVPAFAATETVYDALPNVSPDTSYPSQPFQAQQVYEFGDLIHLGGTNRILDSVTVTMSDYAPYATYASDARYTGNEENWTHPITLNVYSVIPGTPNTVDTLLGSVTQPITIPWRPVGDSGCPVVYGELQWKDDNDVCNSGYAFNATFDLSSLNITLPDDIVVSVAFNTQTYGSDPIEENGPYNSLNVAVPDNQPVNVGSDDFPASVFLSSTYAGAFVDGSLAGTGFVEDTGWTPNGTVALQVTASVPVTRHAEITAPLAGDTVSGWVNFTAFLTDDDADSIQWAVREGTCTAGVGTVFGNVDGYSDSAIVDQSNLSHQTFSFAGDMSAMTPGEYCFIYNPVEDSGEANIRETVEFELVEPVVGPPTDKSECKKDGWMTFNNPAFKNQGQCVSYVVSNDHAGKR